MCFRRRNHKGWHVSTSSGTELVHKRPRPGIARPHLTIAIGIYGGSRRLLITAGHLAMSI